VLHVVGEVFGGRASFVNIAVLWHSVENLLGPLLSRIYLDFVKVWGQNLETLGCHPRKLRQPSYQKYRRDQNVHFHLVFSTVAKFVGSVGVVSRALRSCVCMDSPPPIGAPTTVSPRAWGGSAVLPTQTSWPRGSMCGGWLPLVFHTRVLPLLSWMWECV